MNSNVIMMNIEEFTENKANNSKDLSDNSIELQKEMIIKEEIPQNSNKISLEKKVFSRENHWKIERKKEQMEEEVKSELNLPLGQAFTICINNIIEKQYRLTNKAFMQVIFEKYDYLNILQFFKRLFNWQFLIFLFHFHFFS